MHYLMQNFKSEPVEVKNTSNKDAYQRIKYITVVQENPANVNLIEPNEQNEKIIYLQKEGPASRLI